MEVTPCLANGFSAQIGPVAAAEQRRAKARPAKSLHFSTMPDVSCMAVGLARHVANAMATIAMADTRRLQCARTLMRCRAFVKLRFSAGN